MSQPNEVTRRPGGGGRMTAVERLRNPEAIRIEIEVTRRDLAQLERQLCEVQGFTFPETRLTPCQERLLGVIEAGAWEREQIITESGYRSAAVSDSLAELMALRLIERIGRGMYRRC